jgi:hypothetical protein
VEYQQIAAAAFSAAPSTDFSSLRGAGVLERCGGGYGGLVFGTLLGPETTGPWSVLRPFGVGCGVWDLCFWFPGCTDRTVASPSGVVCVGCVVRGCCLRTT